MARFEVVSKYADADITIPVRATANSAGYDFEVAEETVVQSYPHQLAILKATLGYNAVDLEGVKEITKQFQCKPTLVPTGIKCQMADDEYLEISLRSSIPLKHWLILGNSIGIIDSDYYNNPDNEGEIFFQIINLAPCPIILHKGDKIGQGIIKKYIVTEDDNASGEREGGFGSTSRGMRAQTDAVDEYIIGADVSHV